VSIDVEERIKNFRADLPHGNAADLVRKHITSGERFALSANSYFDLKDRIAATFGIHPAEIVVVGSAKLGFSLAPDKRYRPFGETSDIDVALCSSSLFDGAACPEIRTKNLAEIGEGLTLLTRTLQFVSYVEPQMYMDLFYMERAELQCGDHSSYKRDLRTARQWWNRACVTWHKSKESGRPQRWLPSPPPRGDTCSWSNRN
jgi:hypothetical protein